MYETWIGLVTRTDRTLPYCYVCIKNNYNNFIENYISIINLHHYDLLAINFERV